MTPFEGALVLGGVVLTVGAWLRYQHKRDEREFPRD